MTQPTDTPTQAPVPVKGSKRKTALLVGGILIVVLLAAGIPFYLHAISHESTDDAFVEAHVVRLSPRVAGHVARVLVEENQYVAKGQLLVELDDSDFRAALAAAEAHVDSARAAVTEAEALASAAQSELEQQHAALASQRSGLAEVKANMAEVKADYHKNQSDLDRIGRIAEAGAVSRQTYDHAKADEAIAKAKLTSVKRQIGTQSAKINQARAAIKAAEDKLRQTFAQIEMRQAELRQAEAEAEQARLDLSYTKISAPSDGHVTKKSVEPGSYVQMGQNIMAVVGADTWVVANFKETQISDMRQGQPVAIEVDAYPGVNFTGRVQSIQRGTGSRFSLLPPENATGNFIKVVQRIPVKIVLDANEQQAYLLAPGMSVVPSVDISGPGNGTLKAEADQVNQTDNRE